MKNRVPANDDLAVEREAQVFPELPDINRQHTDLPARDDLLLTPVHPPGLLVPHQLPIPQPQTRRGAEPLVPVLERIAAFGQREEAVGERLLRVRVGGFHAAQEMLQCRVVGGSGVTRHAEQLPARAEHVLRG